MTRSRYSVVEALNRWLRVLEGKAVASDSDDIPGEILSENDVWSDIAELWEDSLPGETLHLPAAGVPFASVEEANAGVSNTVVLSPASHGWAHEWGGIYINTGSVNQDFTASTWGKITGAFQNYMEDSGGEINCDWNDDRIIINELGTYLVDYDLCGYSDGTARTLIDAEVFLSGSAAVSTRSRAELLLTGSYFNLSGGAYVEIPVSGYYVDVRLNPSSGLTIRLDVGQLRVQKAPE
jgi:hypothetical protein